MATVDQHLSHTGGYERRHGRDTLAEVIMIRPERSHRSGLFGSLVTMARVFASPRVQAQFAVVIDEMNLARRLGLDDPYLRKVLGRAW